MRDDYVAALPKTGAISDSLSGTLVMRAWCWLWLDALADAGDDEGRREASHFHLLRSQRQGTQPEARHGLATLMHLVGPGSKGTFSEELTLPG